MTAIRLKVAAALLATILVTTASAAAWIMPNYDWSGNYISADLGGGFGSTSYNFGSLGTVFSDEQTPQPGYSAFSPPHGLSFSQNSDGVIGGGAVGKNWQFNSFVVGIETEMDGADISGTSNRSFLQSVVDDNTPGIPYQYIANDTYNTTINWLYTLTPRIGYAYDNVLFYSKIGFAISEVTSTLTTDHDTGGEYPGSTYYVNNPASFNESQHLVGGNFGAGIDYAVTTHWLLGAEYDYVYFGTNAFGGQNSPHDSEATDYNLGVSSSMIKMNVAYKFNV